MLVEGRINQPPSSPSNSERCPAARGAPAERKIATELRQLHPHLRHHHHHHHHHHQPYQHSHPHRPPFGPGPVGHHLMCTIVLILSSFLLIFLPSSLLIPLCSIIIVYYFYYFSGVVLPSPRITSSPTTYTTTTTTTITNNNNNKLTTTKYLNLLSTILAAPAASSLCPSVSRVEKKKTTTTAATETKKLTKTTKRSNLFSAQTKGQRIQLVAMFLATLIGLDIVSPTLSDSSILADLQRKHSVHSSDSSATLITIRASDPSPPTSAAATTTRSSTSSSIASPTSSAPSAARRKLIEQHEKHFLKMLGLDAKPRPPADHKVHPRMIDFYRLLVGRQLENLLEASDEEDGEATPNPVMISSDDLSDGSPFPFETDPDNEVGAENEDELGNEIATKLESMNKDLEGHHRVPRVRRQTSSPRFTLLGEVNTMTSHPLSTRNLEKINHRMKRSVAAPTPAADESRGDHQHGSLHHEAHLHFEVDLRPGEYLQGAELQLYRHSLPDDLADGMHTPMTSSDQLARHNNFWPLMQQEKVEAGGKAERTKNTVSEYLLRVNLYHLLQPLNETHLNDSRGLGRGGLRPPMKLIDTQVIDVRDPPTFLSFDVMPAVEYWVKHFDSNHGLYLTLVDNSGRRSSSHSSLVVLNPEDSYVQSDKRGTKRDQGETRRRDDEEQEEEGEKLRKEETEKEEEQHHWAELRPHLFTYTSDHPTTRERVPPVRVKRNTRDEGGGRRTSTQQQQQSSSYRGSRRQSGGGGGSDRYNSMKRRKKQRTKQKNSAAYRKYCKRHKLYFDFKEMAWSDWVVAPPGIQAYQCGGECSFPLSGQMNATNHAIIQALVNSKNANVVPSPCCVPTDLSPISLLYTDDKEKMIVKNYPDMVVEGCGCA